MKVTMRALLLPLRVPAFARLAATYTGNELADWLATIALSIAVFDATGSALATTALFLANKFLPALLVPALAARVEGTGVGRLLGGIYVLEAVAIAALAVAVGSLWLPLVLVLAVVDGGLAALARAVTRSATVAVLQPAGMLREGNAALNVGFAAMNTAAPAAAGALVALLGAGAVLGIAAATFAALALLMTTAHGLGAGRTEPAPWHTRLREGLAYVRADARLRTLLGGQALALVLLTMVAPIEVVYAKESLAAGDAGFGALLGAWGAGMVAGSWLFARERRRRVATLIAVSTTAVGAGYLGMAVAPSLALACAASALGGAGNGVQWVAVVTALQEITREEFQARVAGLLETVATGAPGVGFLIGGLVAAIVSPRAAFAVAGAGVLGVLAVGGLVLARRGTPPADATPGGPPGERELERVS
jgi:Transmembrane secretion effector